MKIHLNKPNGEKYLCNSKISNIHASQSVFLNSFLSLSKEKRCSRCYAMIFSSYFKLIGKESEEKMTATIKINMDNAAFDGENRIPETCRILRDIADRLEQGKSVSIRDINGNSVGSISIS